LNYNKKQDLIKPKERKEHQLGRIEMSYKGIQTMITKAINRLLNFFAIKVLRLVLIFAHLCFCIIPCYSSALQEDPPTPVYKVNLTRLAEKELDLIGGLQHPGTLVIHVPSLTLPNYIELTKIRHLHIVTDTLSLPAGLMAPELTLEATGRLSCGTSLYAPAKIGSTRGPFNLTAASVDASFAKIYGFGPSKIKTTVGAFHLGSMAANGSSGSYLVMNDKFTMDLVGAFIMQHAEARFRDDSEIVSKTAIDLTASTIKGKGNGIFDAPTVSLKRPPVTWTMAGCAPRLAVYAHVSPYESLIHRTGDINFRNVNQLYIQASSVLAGGNIFRTGAIAHNSFPYGASLNHPLILHMLQMYRNPSCPYHGCANNFFSLAEGTAYISALKRQYGAFTRFNPQQYLACNTIIEPQLIGNSAGYSIVSPRFLGNVINMELGNFALSLISSARKFISRGNSGLIYNPELKREDAKNGFVQIANLSNVFELEELRSSFYKKHVSGVYTSEHPFGTAYHPTPQQVVFLDRMPTQMFFDPLANIDMDLAIHSVFTQLSGKTFTQGYSGTKWTESFFENAEQWKKENNKKIISAQDLQKALVPLLFYSIRHVAGKEHADLHLSVPSQEIVPYRSAGDIYAEEEIDIKTLSDLAHKNNRLIAKKKIDSISEHGSQYRETTKYRRHGESSYQDFAAPQQQFICLEGPIFQSAGANLSNTGVGTFARGSVTMRAKHGTIQNLPLELNGFSSGKRWTHKTVTHFNGTISSTDGDMLLSSNQDNTLAGTDVSSKGPIVIYSRSGKAMVLTTISEDEYRFRKNEKNLFFTKSKDKGHIEHVAKMPNLSSEAKVVIYGGNGSFVEYPAGKGLPAWTQDLRNANFIPVDEVHEKWNRKSFEFTPQFKALVATATNLAIPGYGSILASAAVTALMDAKGDLRKAAKKFTKPQNLRRLAADLAVKYVTQSIGADGFSNVLTDRIKNEAIKAGVRSATSVFIDHEKPRDAALNGFKGFVADVVCGEMSAKIGQSKGALGDFGNILHIANGALHGTIKDRDPVAGMIGSFIGESGADVFDSEDAGRLSAAIAAFVTRQNISTTNDAADIAVKNNHAHLLMVLPELVLPLLAAGTAAVSAPIAAAIVALAPTKMGNGDLVDWYAIEQNRGIRFDAPPSRESIFFTPAHHSGPSTYFTPVPAYRGVMKESFPVTTSVRQILYTPISEKEYSIFSTPIYQREVSMFNFGFRGSRGFELKNPPYQKTRNVPQTINEKEFSGHVLDQMQNRGLMPSVVEHAINYGNIFHTRDKTIGYYDIENDLRVIVDRESGRIVTTIPGKPNQ
jgi:hypothetical protein